MSAFVSKFSQYTANDGIPLRDTSSVVNHLMVQAGKLLDSRRHETDGIYSAKSWVTKAEKVPMVSMKNV